MAENDLYDEFETISNQLNNLNDRLESLKEQLSKSLEEKEELEMENQNLRKHLEKLGYEDKDFGANGLSTSRLNLEKLYLKGFHVCQPFYGSHRKEDEECVFCQGVIYGNHEKKNKKVK
ncbi:initiation control protein YabA [Companilactobacillus kedongensis]|uniref:initiation control protein YabA n=1 Tax=Companilactobacillus kedongensis TaxID=2486004 RepID=UPI000F799719|nr:initiation control protein YabA [Companilactobacillus kedongensis]